MRLMILYLELLSSPRLFFRDEKGRQEDSFLPGAIAMIAGIVAFVVGLLIATGTHGSAGKTLFSNLSIIFVLVALLSLIYKSALFHLFASLFGGAGAAQKLLRSMLYTYLPYLLLLPAAIILRFLGLDILFLLCFMASAVYSYYLEITLLSEVYGLTMGRAFALFLVPLLVQFIFLLVILLGFFSVIVGFFLKGFGIF